MSHVEFKKRPCPLPLRATMACQMSLRCPCRMSILRNVTVVEPIQTLNYNLDSRCCAVTLYDSLVPKCCSVYLQEIQPKGFAGHCSRFLAGFVEKQAFTSMLWPLTLKFDRATGLSLKFDMRHGAYQHEKKYYRHDMGHSLNSTCDIKPWTF